MRDKFKKPRPSIMAAVKAALKSEKKPSWKLRGSPASVVKARNNRKSVPKVQRLQATGGVVTQSSISRVNKKITPIARTLALNGSPNVYVKQDQFVLNSAAGFQNAQSFSTNSLNDLFAIRNLTNNNVQANPLRYLLQDIMNEVVMTNTTNSSLEVSLYDITCRRDVPFAQTYTTALGTYNLQFGPHFYWDIGTRVMSSQNPVATPGNWTVCGASPFDSQLFKDYFKVAKRTKVMLSQGASHRHFIHLKPNKVILDSEVKTQTGGTIGALAGLTMFTMVVVQGLPQTLGDGSNQATISGGELAVVQQQRYKYTWSQDISVTGTYNDNLATPATTSLINIGSGAIDTFAKTT